MTTGEEGIGANTRQSTIMVHTKVLFGDPTMSFEYWSA